jgi:ADP-heptose:LPS heptosyltransferase
LKKALLNTYLAGRGLPLRAFARAREGFEPSSVRSVLVIRNDRVGDMVLTTPLIRALKESMPSVRLTVLASRTNAEVLTGNPCVDDVLVQEGGLFETTAMLRRKGFDLAVDPILTYELPTAVLCLLSGARYSIGFAAGGREALFNLPCPSAGGKKHMVEHQLDLARALGLDFTPAAPELHVSLEEKLAVRDLLERAGIPTTEGRTIIAMHPGGHYPTQRWPARRFGELAKNLAEVYGAVPVFFSGCGEEGLAEEAASVMSSRPVCIKPGGLREFLAALSVCGMFIGNNSGPLHCAAALMLPTLSFIGPTDPDLFSPYGPGNTVLTAGLSCAPCGKGRCEDMGCMTRITVGDALSAAGEIIKGLGGRT